MKLYTHHVKVRPRDNYAFDFPIDMLRYDGLCPLHEADSGKIAECFGHGSRSGYEVDADFVIELVRRAEKFWKPTEARWQSFLWLVVEHEVIG